AIPDLQRVPRGQACVSSCRLGKGRKEAAGKRDGTPGPQSGNACLQGACSEAAGFWRRDNPAGHPALARLANTPGQGNALPGRAQQVTGAVSWRRTRPTACAMPQFLQTAGRGAGERVVALDV